MCTPIVSVLMPVRDAARFIDAAIRSLREQTLRDFECIIVDDGSTDGSVLIAARHAAEDDRLRILTLPLSGAAVAGNHALAAARCDYVARWGARDVARPERLAWQLAALQAHPAVAVLGCACEVIDAAGVVTGEILVPTAPDEIRRRLPVKNCIVHGTTMMRRQAMLSAGGYRPGLADGEDHDLWLRVALRHELMNLPDRLVACRAA